MRNNSKVVPDQIQNKSGAKSVKKRAVAVAAWRFFCRKACTLPDAPHLPPPMSNKLDEIIAHKRTEVEKLLPRLEKLRAAAALRASDDPRLDPLDPRRRIDVALPALASRIEAACRLELLSAAAELLRIAESEFGEESMFPARGFAAARIRLGD